MHRQSCQPPHRPRLVRTGAALLLAVAIGTPTGSAVAATPDRALFDALLGPMDADGNGRVSQAEWQGFFRTRDDVTRRTAGERAPTDGGRATQFDQLDRNADGFVDAAELAPKTASSD